MMRGQSGSQDGFDWPEDNKATTSRLELQYNISYDIVLHLYHNNRAVRGNDDDGGVFVSLSAVVLARFFLLLHYDY